MASGRSGPQWRKLAFFDKELAKPGEETGLGVLFPSPFALSCLQLKILFSIWYGEVSLRAEKALEGPRRIVASKASPLPHSLPSPCPPSFPTPLNSNIFILYFSIFLIGENCRRAVFLSLLCSLSPPLRVFLTIFPHFRNCKNVSLFFAIMI